MEQIPFVAHEADMTRMERVIRRLWVLCIVLVLMLVGTNAGWLYYESQFEDSVVTQTAEAEDGSSAIINGSGTVTYGGEGDGDN